MCVTRCLSGVVVTEILSNLLNATFGLGYIATHVKVSNLCLFD